jgi:hypothetical protein
VREWKTLGTNKKEYERLYREANQERRRERNRANYAAKKEKYRAKQRAWWVANKEKALRASKAWRKTNPTKVKRHKRAANLKKKYSITLAQYEVMQESQRGLCAICNRPETNTYRGKPIALSVDHCATTGKVRGLLCADCNTSIGKFDHSPERLRAAAVYLERYKQNG